ncbi:MAG: hypothetical protein JWO02_3445 [Solirubrobacterales bacterium]|nr:hypothetical protein [Solirubrobacterales bacterium]
MAPEPHSPTKRSTQGSSSKLSYVFAFGAAVFIVSGNYYVAAFFGLMAAAAVAVTIRNLPSGAKRAAETGEPKQPGGSATSGIDA